MTSCLGSWLEKGLVLAFDSRTNAGVDYISTYSKMYTFQPAADRPFVLLAAGSLATTQAVVNWIRRDLDRPAEPAEGAARYSNPSPRKKPRGSRVTARWA